MSDLFFTVINYYKRMRTHEVKCYKRFLELNEEGDPSKSKSLILLKILEAKKSLSEEESIKRIYGENSQKNKLAFRKLLERFRDKMYDSNFLDSNLFRSEFNSPYYMAIMESKKLIGIAYNVISRGVSLKETNRLLNKGLSISQDFEFYDEVINFLNIKFVVFGQNPESPEAKKIIHDLYFAIECKDVCLKSQILSYKYINSIQYKSNHNPILIDEIRDAADQAKKYYEKYKLWNLYYNWTMLEMQYCHYVDDYKTAESYNKELIIAMKTKSALRQYNKISMGYNNLGYTQAYLYKFLDAVESANEAMKYAVIMPSVQNMYIESKAILNIYLLQYEESAELLERIIADGDLGNSPEQLSRRKYLLSTVKYLQKKYKESFILLQDTKEIEDEKEGWNIGIRLLQIYLTLETNKVDLADQRIESLRKHIERTTKMKSLRKRDVVLFRILRQLAYTGFDFKEVWETRQKDFVLLKSNEKDYKWMPRSHELIIFDQWFFAKVVNKEYIPVFPSPTENDDPVS